MIPGSFVTLGQLSCSPNGKVDAAALSATDHISKADAEFESPRNPSEQALAKVWQEILGTDFPISRNAHFL